MRRLKGVYFAEDEIYVVGAFLAFGFLVWTVEWVSFGLFCVNMKKIGGYLAKPHSS